MSRGGLGRERERRSAHREVRACGPVRHTPSSIAVAQALHYQLPNAIFRSDLVFWREAVRRWLCRSLVLAKGPSTIPAQFGDHCAPPVAEKFTPHRMRRQRMPTRSNSRKTNRTATKQAYKPVAGLLAITVDPDTARVVRLEGLDANGARHELTNAERQRLLKRASDGRVEDFVERAFEAGIACVLDGEASSDTNQESDEDAEIRRRFLTPLIERSPVKHLMESAVLDRAILSTLIDHSTKTPSNAEEES